MALTENRSLKRSLRFFESDRAAMRKESARAGLFYRWDRTANDMLSLTEVDETHRTLTDAALPGAGSRSARRFSAVGYALQTLFDYVSVPADLARLVFFGLFEWNGVLALLAGIIAVWTGRSRSDWTFRLGIIASCMWRLRKRLNRCGTSPLVLLT